MTDVFDEGYFARLAAAGDHWWVRGMRQVAEAVLGPVERTSSVLDAGCGNGNNLEWLAGTGARVTAVDLAPLAVQRWRGDPAPARLARASVATLPFRDRAFDVVVCLDVVQHLVPADEARALGELRRVLRPGGRLLVRTNSAFGRRGVSQRPDWRLYTEATLDRALSGAGLVVERITSANCLNSLVALVPRPTGHRRVEHRPRPATTHDPGAKDHHVAPPASHGLGIPQSAPRLANLLWSRVMAAEALWLAKPGRRLPFGHTLVALARRPVSSATGSPTPETQTSSSATRSPDSAER